MFYLRFSVDFDDICIAKVSENSAIEARFAGFNVKSNEKTSPGDAVPKYFESSSLFTKVFNLRILSYAKEAEAIGKSAQLIISIEKNKELPIRFHKECITLNSEFDNRRFSFPPLTIMSNFISEINAVIDTWFDISTALDIPQRRPLNQIEFY